MTVVYRASVPIYEVDCDECHSVIRYQKAEARPNQGYIKCPVCGVPVRALAVNPVTVLDDEEQKKRDISNADRIRAMTDEEMAEWCCHGCCPSDRGGSDIENCNDNNCYECWLEWLRREDGNG